MKIVLEVEDDGVVSQTLECEAATDETAMSVAKRLSDQLGVDVEEILPDLGVERDQPFKHDGPERRVRHRRVCVDLHFETEHVRHRFSAHARWARVRRWGCRRFDVPRDACANLELREGDPTGQALNEQRPIGVFPGCKTVWLIKPGAEPNG
jgi:hypothetical protein